MKRSLYGILEKPLITEKSLAMKENNRTLCFRVDRDATKPEIRHAVQSLFKVKVESVRTAIFRGKVRRRGRLFGYRPEWKKAYVTLQAGEKMPEFAGA